MPRGIKVTGVNDDGSINALFVADTNAAAPTIEPPSFAPAAGSTERAAWEEQKKADAALIAAETKRLLDPTSALNKHDLAQRDEYLSLMKKKQSELQHLRQNKEREMQSILSNIEMRMFQQLSSAKRNTSESEIYNILMIKLGKGTLTADQVSTLDAAVQSQRERVEKKYKEEVDKLNSHLTTLTERIEVISHIPKAQAAPTPSITTGSQKPVTPARPGSPEVKTSQPKPFTPSSKDQTVERYTELMRVKTDSRYADYMDFKEALKEISPEAKAMPFDDYLKKKQVCDKWVKLIDQGEEVRFDVFEKQANQQDARARLAAAQQATPVKPQPVFKKYSDEDLAKFQSMRNLKANPTELHKLASFNVADRYKEYRKSEGHHFLKSLSGKYSDKRKKQCDKLQDALDAFKKLVVLEEYNPEFVKAAENLIHAVDDIKESLKGESRKAGESGMEKLIKELDQGLNGLRADLQTDSVKAIGKIQEQRHEGYNRPR